VQDDGARGDLWALDLSSGVHSRLTFGPEDVNAARWSADSNRIVFSVYSGGQQEFRELSIGALGSKRIYGDALPKRLDDWTRDGRFLVYEAREDSVRSLTILPFQEPKPIPFLRSSFSKSTSRVSPDGRWIAYGSNESGRFEVYVASFPSFTQIKQISRDGGIAPEWSKGGRELFYVANNLDLMVVDVTLGATVVAGTPERLFRTKIIPVNLLASQYAVTSDGQRILVREAISSFGPEVVHVVLNWPAALGR
jgi:Tol biopolymer transport system component